MAAALDWPMGHRAEFWLIHFYLTYPELRDELADHCVVERMAAGRIFDEVARHHVGDKPPQPWSTTPRNQRGKPDLVSEMQTVDFVDCVLEIA